MAALFADVPSALANTVAIAQRCNLTLVLGKPQLPDFPTPIQVDGTPMPMDDYFRQASFEGLEQAAAAAVPRRRKRERQRRATSSGWSSRSPPS
jgi:DNA polymerase-3 subunit alpha